MNMFTKNIRYLIDKSRLTYKEVSSGSGVHGMTIGRYYRGEQSNPDQATLDALATYFGVSSEDLRKADLEMLSKNNIEGQGKNDVVLYSTPLIEAYSSAGDTQTFNDMQNAPIKNIQLDIKCDAAIYNYGHSMYPTVQSGDILAVNRVRDPSLLHWGHVYVIQTVDQQYTKRIQKSKDKDCILGVSDNDELKNNYPRYDVMEFPKDKIIAMYRVVRILRATDN